MTSNSVQFRDRIEAGQVLAETVQRAISTETDSKTINPNSIIVISLPRGGTIVADQLATALHCTHDVIFPRKVGCPGHEEYALGAITDAGNVVWTEVAKEMNASQKREVQRIVEEETMEAQRRKAIYRGNRPPLKLDGYEVVIIVDDGIATGATMQASIEACRLLGAKKIMLAVPCASPRAIELLSPIVEKVICLHSPNWFRAVGQFYQIFDQTTDQEVINILIKY